MAAPHVGPAQSNTNNARSIVQCKKCKKRCYEDIEDSILSSEPLSTVHIFKDGRRCVRCQHSVDVHERMIDPDTIKQLFTDAKTKGDIKDIVKRIRYLGHCADSQQRRLFINMLKDSVGYGRDTSYVWMAIVWKNNFLTAEQKLQFIQTLDAEFDVQWNLTNEQGLNIIHMLCHNDNICDKDSSILLLKFFMSDCKSIDPLVFKSLCTVNRCTPLHYAVLYCKEHSVKLLVHCYNRTDLLVKDRQGQTVFDLAKLPKQRKFKLDVFLKGYMEQLPDDDDDNEDEKTSQLYHESQKLEMCLMHALNSLVQDKQFTSIDLDEICKELAPNKLINPHKSLLFTGNYDANVLIMALQRKDIDVQWYDARKANEFDLDNSTMLAPNANVQFVGFILNNPYKKMLILRRHWLTIKKIDNFWWNLDSRLPEPKRFDNANICTKFIRDALKTNNAELLICRTKK
eukprot:CAMPEP_0202714002 /NCGR_PEP_ID=MMETSP1385-20130828/62267_1 /ASSEMBLY_ACC=CAM_ASM_000861 /TAXON_ID=933848 /ORGANISM="Elphidium margaritaceum" /LENGTH=455 /DNA_ID=CAMNT_0049374563 /DNA_START=17 /DNA_END=1384 /DNA_ORIENTATION=-